MCGHGGIIRHVWGLERVGKCAAIQADTLLSLQAAAHRYGAEMLQITTLTALWAFTGEDTLQKVNQYLTAILYYYNV